MPLFRMDTNKEIRVKTEDVMTVTSADAICHEVEIFVEGSNLIDLDFFSLSDPQCTLKTRDHEDDQAEYKFLGETEPIDNNLNPKWIKYFTLMYEENRDIDLLFQVYNYNDRESKDLIGGVEITLFDLLKSDNHAVKLKLKME